MLSLCLSTIAFFVASFYLRRYLDEQGMPKGMARNLLIFSIALLLCYGVARVVDYL